MTLIASPFLKKGIAITLSTEGEAVLRLASLAAPSASLTQNSVKSFCVYLLSFLDFLTNFVDLSSPSIDYFCLYKEAIKGRS